MKSFSKGTSSLTEDGHFSVLCLSEKAFAIRNLDDGNMLNKTSEFILKCRHINKRLLNRVKDDSND